MNMEEEDAFYDFRRNGLKVRSQGAVESDLASAVQDLGMEIFKVSYLTLGELCVVFGVYLLVATL